MTEAQARARGSDIRVLRWPYHENDRAQAEGTTVGHIKVVTNRRGKVLGATIVGAGAGELITTWALAIAKRSNISTFLGIIIPYPTLAEIGKRAAMTYFSPGFDQRVGAAHHRLYAPLRLSRGARINGRMTEGPAAAGQTEPHAPASRTIRQAPRPHVAVRDDRGSADLCPLGCQLPPELAQRPPLRRLHRGAGVRDRAERHGHRHSGAPDPGTASAPARWR